MSVEYSYNDHFSSFPLRITNDIIWECDFDEYCVAGPTLYGNHLLEVKIWSPIQDRFLSREYPGGYMIFLI